MNPFYKKYDTLFGTIPFSKITLAHYKPAIEEGIKQSLAEIDVITASQEAPRFDNTIVALENTGEVLDRVTSVFFNINSAETSPEMQKLAQEVSPLLSAYKNDVMMNAGLFERVKLVYNDADAGYSEEQKTLLKNTYRSFERNGANLSETDQSILRDIDNELSKLSLTFGENVLIESNSYQLYLQDEADLIGLPEGIKDAAAQAAKQHDAEGQWLFTLDYPSYVPFVTYSAVPALREKMHKAFSSKAFGNNEQNNTTIIQQLVTLRYQRAQLLGFESHAAFVLTERMAESPTKVYDFLDNIQDKAYPFAEKEFNVLSEYAKKLDGIEQLEKWDGAYYAEKLKKEKFNIDDELLRPYFQLEKVVDGVFQTAEKLFGITFHQNSDIEVYHPEVTTYEVKDQNGNHLAIFYADFFPRSGKRQGAWMTSFQSQKIVGDTDRRPHISIVCNFTKPTEQKPSLLTFNEVTTLFHEFGHALHGIMANGTFGSLSGTSVYWDFVELPSQLMENWCYEKACLDLFAKHYETDQPIPAEYIDRIKDSANFMSGMATIRQVSLAKIDMGWHSKQIKGDVDVKVYEKSQIQGLEFYPDVKEACTSTAFSHIFQGGYSSGYYSYKWAEVLDADAFEAFQENGIFDKVTATAFKKHILSAGGSEHPSILYKRFRGRDAKPDALLKRAGLVTKTQA
ncbi:MAG: Zn-dependent oligopeptidase [Bacteroidia bacterium]|jgi:Zn-dependent oligopeptidase